MCAILTAVSCTVMGKINRGDSQILIVKKSMKNYPLIIGSFISDKPCSVQTSISKATISMVLSSVVSDACAIDGIWEARHKARWLPVRTITHNFDSFITDASAMPTKRFNYLVSMVY